jgi:hypothetical protein
VTVGGAYVTGVDFGLSTGAALNGRLVNSATLQGLTFDDNVFPSITSADSGLPPDGFAMSRDMAGNFSLYALPAGAYKIRWEGDNFYTTYHRNVFDPALSSTLEVTQAGEIDLGLVYMLPCSEADPRPPRTPTPIPPTATSTAPAPTPAAQMRSTFLPVTLR